MEIIDNINHLLGDNLKQTIKPGSKLKIAASCFSIYAFAALKKELESIEELEFIFTSPTFVATDVTDKFKKERREFHIPKAERERSFYGSDFEIQLKNKLTQKAIAKECADWMRRKAVFRSNRGKAPMQQFACVQGKESAAVYMPLHGFTAVDLGYQQGDAVSNMVNKMDEPTITPTYLSLFDQIWNDTDKLEDVTTRLCEHIASVYQENSPERIYFLMLYNIFNEFLEDINEDVLPNDLTGYKDSLIWQKLFNFQKDAATGIINKLETYSGCILADSVGLGKTFTALAVVKYYELRNKSVLVLCPKKLADNWLNYNRNLKTNIFVKDRFNYDVLCHTDLQRTSVSGSSGSCTGNAVTATTAFECTGNSATATNASNLNGTAGLCGYSTALASIAYVGAGGPQVMGSTTNAAMLSFHRAGAYAVNFGLDTDNVLKVGGWSMGAVAYPIYHAGNPIALAPPAGTATVAPIKLAAGTNLTAPVAGALEYDGVNAYFTQDTTQGRGAIPTTQQFVVGTNQAAFGPTVGNFFGATSAISLNGSSAYCIDCFCYFTKTTAGTLTFAPTVSSAASLIHSTYEATPILGFSGTLQTGASLTGLNATVNSAVAATHLATGSLSTAVQHIFRFKIYIITALGCNFRLNVSQSAGTLTVLAGSHYKVTRIGNSAGNFVA